MHQASHQMILDIGRGMRLGRGQLCLQMILQDYPRHHPDPIPQTRGGGNLGREWDGFNKMDNKYLSALGTVVVNCSIAFVTALCPVEHADNSSSVM